jgi:hypothetical protein
VTFALSADAVRVLTRGTFASMAAFTGGRIHLTPVVFAFDGRRLWLTTSRTSVKARAWRQDPRTAGLVVDGGLAVTFSGRVRAFDLLDPKTWAASALRSPLLTRAAARFTTKNTRFFAGYARDAHKVPLSWTPPARVFASVDLEAAALLDPATGTVVERWGTWGDRVRASSGYRSPGGGGDHDLEPAEDVAEAVGAEGDGALAVDGAHPAVVPCRWRADGGDYLAGVALSHLALAGPRSPTGASLTAQRASAWRAREMRGFLAQGRGTVHVPARTRSGRASLERDLEGLGEALVRVRPDRLVWWSGWTTGTVGA